MIHGKKLLALAGHDTFGKAFISVVNKEISSSNLFVIGININDEDFDFFISNLANSKVEVTIFMPEFQEKAAKYFGLDAHLVIAYKKDDSLHFIQSEEKTEIDDKKLLELTQRIANEDRF